MTAGSLMAAEMAEQPAVIAGLARRRTGIVSAVADAIPERLAGIVLVARGSSDHAAIYGRYVLEQAAGRPVALAAPSLQTIYGADVDYTDHVAIAVSQSGRTPEIVTMLQRLGEAGARTVAVTNEGASPLAQAADAAVALEAGEERAVPATKTFTAQLAAFAIIAEAFGRVPWRPEEWDALPGAVQEVLNDGDRPSRAADMIGDAAGLIAVARGYLFCVALEAALKLKETTALLAEGYSAADFRHGPIAVVARGLPVLAFSVSGPAAQDVQALAAEARERGGLVLTASDTADADLPLPAGVHEALAPIPAAVRGQQVAHALALLRGIDPDAPFGLRKVTPTT